jgi:hypothetical protein
MLPRFQRFSRLLWLVGTLTCQCVTEPDRTAPVAYDGRGFSATLRKDVSSNAMPEHDGVTLYDFHVGSMPLVFMYAGDRPGYPHFAWTQPQTADLKLASGLSGQCRSMRVEQGISRECLIDLSRKTPKQLHVWYDQLTSDWSQAADRIIASIEPRGP